jgi:hypothetical protein
MPPAIRAYSIAVAADSSAKKAWNFLIMAAVFSDTPKVSVKSSPLIRALFSSN